MCCVGPFGVSGSFHFQIKDPGRYELNTQSRGPHVCNTEDTDKTNDGQSSFPLPTCALTKQVMVTQMTAQLVLCSRYTNRGYRSVFPLTTRDRVQWYVHDSAHEHPAHPALTFLRAVCTYQVHFLDYCYSFTALRYLPSQS